MLEKIRQLEIEKSQRENEAREQYQRFQREKEEKERLQKEKEERERFQQSNTDFVLFLNHWTDEFLEFFHCCFFNNLEMKTQIIWVIKPISFTLKALLV